MKTGIALLCAVIAVGGCSYPLNPLTINDTELFKDMTSARRAVHQRIRDAFHGRTPSDVPGADWDSPRGRALRCGR